MTTIDRLTEIEKCDEYDLFIVYDSSRARSISAKNLKKYITESGFDPDAFISGRIDTVNEILYMTNRAGEEIEIGPVISTLSVHEIQELQNVPPLEAGKLFKVNSTGDRVVFETPFTLSDHFIEELANVPNITANAFLRGTADGTGTEWIASSGGQVGIQDDGVAQGDAHTLNFDGSITANVHNDIATISFNDETGYVTLDTDQTITGKKDFTAPQRFGDALQIYFSGGNPALDIFAVPDGVEFVAQDNSTGTTAIEVAKDGKVSFPATPEIVLDTDVNTFIQEQHFRHGLYVNESDSDIIGAYFFDDGSQSIISASNGTDTIPAIEINRDGSVNLPNTTDNPHTVYSNKDTFVGADWRICRDAALLFNTGLSTNEDSNQDRYRYRLDSGVLKLESTTDTTIWKPLITQDDKGVSLYSEGKLAVETYNIVTTGGQEQAGLSSGNGVDVQGAYQLKTEGNSFGFTASLNGDTVVINQVDKDGAFVKDHILMEKDGNVTLAYNGVATLRTTQIGVSIGTGTANSIVIQKSGDLEGQIWDQGIHRIAFRPDGSSSLLGTWTGTVTPSDITLKDNLTPLDGLNKINLLEPFEWSWKAENQAANDSDSIGAETHKGFTAQSYQKVFPNLVEEIQPEDLPDEITAEQPVLGIKKDITGLEMDALLVDAIKTLKAQNEDLTKRLESLENKVNTNGGVN